MQLGFLEGISANHKYKEKVKAEGAQPRPRTVRLGKEIAGLNNDLPLNPTSSVFVRVDEQNSSLWRALITGMLRLLPGCNFNLTGGMVETMRVAPFYVITALV